MSEDAVSNFLIVGRGHGDDEATVLPCNNDTYEGAMAQFHELWGVTYGENMVESGPGAVYIDAVYRSDSPMEEA